MERNSRSRRIAGVVVGYYPDLGFGYLVANGERIGLKKAALKPHEIESIAAFATYPLVAVMTTTKALQENLAVLASAHSSRDLPRARTSMDEFKSLIGYDEVVALQGACQ